jgi:hypothetical protein
VAGKEKYRFEPKVKNLHEIELKIKNKYDAVGIKAFGLCYLKKKT